MTHKMATTPPEVMATSSSHCVTSLPLTLSSATRLIAIVFFIINAFCISPFKVEAFHCKFPNEGCDINNGQECCSGKCVDLHPGTNARCTRLSLHKPCLYTYQCDDRLRCGANNTCCSRYWGTCREARDCCDPQHSCYEVEGFYYKRCLYARAGASFLEVTTASRLLSWNLGQHDLMTLTLLVVASRLKL